MIGCEDGDGGENYLQAEHSDVGREEVPPSRGARAQR